MKSCTIKVAFFTAHFKRHETKKFRSTYLLPPPTAIWGIVGNIFGIKREDLVNFVKRNSLIVGGELLDFKGLAGEKATLHKWEEKFGGYISTPEDFEFLIEPIFRIAIGGEYNSIEELMRRIDQLSFEYDVYGGISDCFLKEIEVEDKDAIFEEVTWVRGMVPRDIIKSHRIIDQAKRSILQPVLWYHPFVQGFNVEFETQNPVKAINGIAAYGYDDIEKLREATKG